MQKTYWRPSVWQSLNNPWNILSTGTNIQTLGATGEIQHTNWYKYLKFATPLDGFRAMKKLLTSDAYKNLTVADAMRKWTWSKNPVHLKVIQQYLPSILNKKISELNSNELKTLLVLMAKSEWYFNNMSQEQKQQILRDLYNNNL